MQFQFFAFFLGGVLLGTGTAFAAAPCPSGHTKLDNVNSGTFVSPVDGVCQIGGYSLLTIPDELSPIYNGFTLGSQVTMCDEGHPNGNSCNTFSQGSCADGNYNTDVKSSTFMAPVDGICQVGGYSLLTISDDLTPVYNGMLLGSEVALCDNGHWSGTTCVTSAQGDCISNYYDLGINANTIAELTNGGCSSPYATFTGTTRCDHNPGDTCVDLPTPIISITWDDGVNSPSTTTCYYEEIMTLPTTPTRPGYIFNGWRVKQ